MPNKKKQILKGLYKNYIKGTKEKAPVISKTVFFCYLTRAVTEVLQEQKPDLQESKVYINTKALKHCYDRKPAEEFDFLIDNLNQIITYPDKIYKNRNPKRGDFCFVKNLKGDKYFCSLEFVSEQKKMLFVTSFRLRKESYLKNYKLLWSWKDGAPSS